MKFILPILFFVISLNVGFLSAHQSHFEKNTYGISNTEIVTVSNTTLNKESIWIPGDINNVDMCCCSDELCLGPDRNVQEVSCKSHCEGLSNEINLTNQNSKIQDIHNLSLRINILFIKTDSRNSKISQKIISPTIPIYISIQSFLI